MKKKALLKTFVALLVSTSMLTMASNSVGAVCSHNYKVVDGKYYNQRSEHSYSCTHSSHGGTRPTETCLVTITSSVAFFECTNCGAKKTETSETPYHSNPHCSSYH